MSATRTKPSGPGRRQTATGRSGLPVDLDRLGLWPLRIAWLVMPATVGFGLTGTFDHLDEGPKLGIELWWWLLWFAGLLATLVPNPISATVIRTLAPISLVSTVVAGVVSGEWSAALLVAIGWNLATVILAFGPTVGDRLINGSAYGSERRMTLKPPAAALIGPVPFGGLALALAALAPPLLLAAGQPIPAAAAVAVGAGVAWAVGRLLHQLARRWIVFVPAGFVIHDPFALIDAVLLRRTSIASLGPALAEVSHEQTDLTAGASGLSLEAQLKAPIDMTTRSGRSGAQQLSGVTNVVFTPSLPGALLAEARIRAIKIGTADGIIDDTVDEERTGTAESSTDEAGDEG